MTPRVFTLDEAESLLPRLTGLMLDLQSSQKEHEIAQEEAAALLVRMKSNGHGLEDRLAETRQGIERAVERLNSLMQQVQEIGCEVKGIEQGLVDFRSEIGGREVYLCWKLGEERIEWWHDLDTGFAGRQPLPRGNEAGPDG